jgi:hypothetical protein
VQPRRARQLSAAPVSKNAAVRSRAATTGHPQLYEPSATRMYAGDFGLRTVPVIGRILQPCVGPGEAQSGRR